MVLDLKARRKKGFVAKVVKKKPLLKQLYFKQPLHPPRHYFDSLLSEVLKKAAERHAQKLFFYKGWV